MPHPLDELLEFTTGFRSACPAGRLSVGIDHDPEMPEPQVRVAVRGVDQAGQPYEWVRYFWLPEWAAERKRASALEMGQQLGVKQRRRWQPCTCLTADVSPDPRARIGNPVAGALLR